MLDYTRYIDFLEKHKLTQAQFLLLLLVYKKEYKLIERYKKMYPTDNGSMIGKYPFEDLINRGFVEIIGKDKTANSFKITKKFTKIFCDEYEAGNQVWDLYPTAIISNSVKMPMKLWDKNEMRKEYFKRIRGNYDEHLEVIKDLEYAIENNLIKGKLENFIKSEAWTDIRKERLNEVIQTPNNNDF